MGTRRAHFTMRLFQKTRHILIYFPVTGLRRQRFQNWQDGQPIIFESARGMGMGPTLPMMRLFQQRQQKTLLTGRLAIPLWLKELPIR